MRRQLSQFELLAGLAADRSGWTDVRHYPDTVTCRRFLRLADWAAADPRRWRTCRLAYECPELSFREIAAVLGFSLGTVQRHVAPADLSDPADFMPGELLEDALPAWLFVCPVQFDATAPSLTYRRACRLADWAAGAPQRWRVIRFAAQFPDATQSEIAAACGVCERSVRTYLQPFRLVQEDDFDDEIL